MIEAVRTGKIEEWVLNWYKEGKQGQMKEKDFSLYQYAEYWHNAIYGFKIEQ